MKKCSLILFFIFFAVEYSNAQSPIIDSVVVRHCLIRDIGEYEYNASIVDSFNTDDLLISTTQFDSLNSVMWNENYTYSATGKIVRDVYMSLRITGGIDSLVKTYTYDSNDSLINTSYLRYYSGLLYGGSGTIIQYDSINHSRIIFNQNCDSSGIWILQSQVLDTFNITGNLIRRDFASANGTVSMTNWFEYLPNDSIDLYYFLDQSPLFQSDSGMYNYSYDSMRYLISIEKFLWDSAAATFGNPDEYWGIYYDSTHTLIGKSSGWYLGIPGAQWELWDTTYYQYDSQQRLIYENESLIPHNGHWTEYTYYAGTNDLDSVNYCRWATQSGNCSFCKYEYYALILGTKNEKVHQLKVFPNPAIDHVQIIFPETKKEKINIRITDLQSKIVFHRSFIRESNFILVPDLNLSNGLYLISVEQSDLTQTFKLMINKH